MKTFKIEVLETQVVRKMYYIEAGSLNEAVDRAGIGDTDAEVDIKNDGVIDRQIVDAQLEQRAACGDPPEPTADSAPQ